MPLNHALTRVAAWGNTILWHDGPVCAWLTDDRSCYVAMGVERNQGFDHVALELTEAARLRFLRGAACLRTLMLEEGAHLFAVGDPVDDKPDTYCLVPLEGPPKEDWLPLAGLTWSHLSALDDGRLRT